jgi:hypothetical protein
MTDKPVSHAIERGIDFLFAIAGFAETSRGYERILGSSSPSDEWVTAYAACALLHTNEERSVWAAREALHALVDESAIMRELTARPVGSLIASEQMNLAGVREWTCRRRSDHWQAGHGGSRTSYITDEQYLRL